jgi:parallel beta-helix repeat protein
VTVRGFEIAYGQDCDPGIMFEGSHNTFADNYIYLNASCLGVNAITCRDHDGGTDYNIIEGNTIDQADIGIIIQAATPDAINRGNTIRDNTLLGIAGLAIGVEGGSGSLITGNDIKGVSDGICIAVGTGTGNTIPQGHHTVVNNTMGKCARNGISVYAAPGGSSTHNRVAGNWIQECGADCIALEAGEEATLSYNQVLDNEASFSGLCGIKVGSYPVNAPGASLSNNLVQGNLVFRNLSGVCLTSGADNNMVLKNVTQDNTDDGFVLHGHGNMLMGNEAHGNDWAGIQVQGEDNTIVSNSAHDNDVSGIDVDGKNNRISTNTANDNGQAGIWLEGDDNEIWNDTALGNGVYDLADYGAGNRWWNNEYETANW